MPKAGRVPDGASFTPLDVRPSSIASDFEERRNAMSILESLLRRDGGGEIHAIDRAREALAEMGKYHEELVKAGYSIRRRFCAGVACASSSNSSSFVQVRHCDGTGQRRRFSRPHSKASHPSARRESLEGNTGIIEF